MPLHLSFVFLFTLELSPECRKVFATILDLRLHRPDEVLKSRVYIKPRQNTDINFLRRATHAEEGKQSRH
jgi:hypothetical protein